jgi:hypothetical protein
MCDSFFVVPTSHERVKKSTLTAETAETAEKTVNILGDLCVLCGSTCIPSQAFHDRGGSRGYAGGGTRRFDAASYADATLRIRFSAPGSARKTSENGRPGAGSVVDVLLLVAMYRFLSALSTKVGS